MEKTLAIFGKVKIFGHLKKEEGSQGPYAESSLYWEVTKKQAPLKEKKGVSGERNEKNQGQQFLQL